MSFVPAPHPPEFRQRAVDLARSGIKPIAAIAKELSISESCLRNWLAQADTDEGRSNSSRLSSDEKRELAELRKKVDELASASPELRRLTDTSLERWAAGLTED